MDNSFFESNKSKQFERYPIKTSTYQNKQFLSNNDIPKI